MDQDALNTEHLNDPQIGDYWHDRFSGVLVVVDTPNLTPDKIVVATDRVSFHKGYWTFDLNACQLWTRERFKTHLSYRKHNDSITYASDGKTWADVLPRRVQLKGRPYLLKCEPDQELLDEADLTLEVFKKEHNRPPSLKEAFLLGKGKRS